MNKLPPEVGAFTMKEKGLIPHLFRSEFGKITSVLCKYLGPDQIDLAEDIAGEVFLKALETWPYQGVPPNPVGWLYTVAKNKTKNHLHRSKTFTEKVSPQLRFKPDGDEPDLSDSNILDSQLRMMFVVCHPGIPVESQIALSLRILCGFGIEEIATAFLTNKETINKRLFRAKEKLRASHITIEIPPPSELDARIESVLTTLYLMFSEGYYSESQNTLLREDLCEEARRLTFQLVENDQLTKPEVYALYALMCFHSSRFPARRSIQSNQFILYDEQDDSLWDQELIARGALFLNKASTGDQLSRYHLEAAIAYWHTVKSDDKKWTTIFSLYNQLLEIIDSPIVELNRIYAMHRCGRTKEAISDAKKLNLVSSHFYFMLLGELYQSDDKNQAVDCYLEAIRLAKTETERSMIRKRMDSIIV